MLYDPKVSLSGRIIIGNIKKRLSKAISNVRFRFSTMLFACTLMFISTVPASAYRPFTTEDAGVAGRGVLQMEISYDFFKWRNGDTDQIFLLVSPLYGPTENIELSVETPYIIHHSNASGTAEGVGNINLVEKYVLLWENYEKKGCFIYYEGDYQTGHRKL